MCSGFGLEVVCFEEGFVIDVGILGDFEWVWLIFWE